MHTIDCQGLRCPMPLLKAKLAYTQLSVGESFVLIADDPAAGPDIQRWAERVAAPIQQLSDQPLTLEIGKIRA